MGLAQIWTPKEEGHLLDQSIGHILIEPDMLFDPDIVEGLMTDLKATIEGIYSGANYGNEAIEALWSDIHRANGKMPADEFIRRILEIYSADYLLEPEGMALTA